MGETPIRSVEPNPWKGLYGRMRDCAATLTSHCVENATVRRVEKEFNQIEYDARVIQAWEAAK